jgi:hypothetical protein
LLLVQTLFGSEQSKVSTHSTQTLVSVLQIGKLGSPQYESSVHSTQVLLSVLQAAKPLGQSSLAIHSTQTFSALQTPANPQSSFKTHSTQTPFSVSQNSPFSFPRQSSLIVHSGA